MNRLTLLKSAALVALAVLLFPSSPRAQTRDHLTPEEVELVRDNQELDKRTQVFVKAAERRVLAVTNPEEYARQSVKDKEKWGEVKGTRVQLFYDVSKILEEAATNIDDSATHNPDSPLLRKSLYLLSEAVNRILPQLAKFREAAQDEAEADQLDHAIEAAQEITGAAQQHGVKAEDLKVKDAKAGKKGN
jgi:hypothetical protein